MTSESIRMEFRYPAGHRNRHIPHLCLECRYPLTSRGRCTHCTGALAPLARERPVLLYPNRRVRLERMERVARR
jgi:hypothetical protein